MANEQLNSESQSSLEITNPAFRGGRHQFADTIISNTYCNFILPDGTTPAGESLNKALTSILDKWTIGNTDARAIATEREGHHSIDGVLKQDEDPSNALHTEELKEIEHHYQLERAANRLLQEWLRDQDNVENIASLSIDLANNDPDNGKERPLDNDWLLRFFQYAAKVDDKQLQEVMARVLADAAIADRPLTSRRAIDTIRFFESSSYTAFQFVARELTIFGNLPGSYFSLCSSAAPPYFDTSMSALIELGLVKIERRKSFELSLGKLTFHFTFSPRQTFSFDVVLLTQIGREISALLLPEVRNRFPLSGQNPSPPLLWGIQKKLGLKEHQVKSAATAIVQEASDFWDIAYDIFIRTSSTEAHTVYKGTRDSIEKPYSIPDLDFIGQSVDSHLSSLAQIVVNEFRYFDEMQLPNMIIEPYGS